MSHSLIGNNGTVSDPREIVLLGSTGSIGTQAIDIVRRNPDRVPGGRARCRRRQRRAARRAGARAGRRRGRRGPRIDRAGPATRVLRGGAAARGTPTGGFRVPKIVAGPDAMTELAAWPCDVVLNAVVGSLGLAPTLAALRAGRTLALANKESLVAGGPLVRAIARPGQIVPVDSEHSALAQCLRSGTPGEVRAADPDRERRPVPRTYRETSWAASPRSRRWPTRPGTWVRSSRSTRPRWSTRRSR